MKADIHIVENDKIVNIFTDVELQLDLHRGDDFTIEGKVYLIESRGHHLVVNRVHSYVVVRLK